MIWYYMYPETEGVTDLPFYVYSIGLHELQKKETALREKSGQERETILM